MDPIARSGTPQDMKAAEGESRCPARPAAAPLMALFLTMTSSLNRESRRTFQGRQSALHSILTEF